LNKEKLRSVKSLLKKEILLKTKKKSLTKWVHTFIHGIVEFCLILNMAACANNQSATSDFHFPTLTATSSGLFRRGTPTSTLISLTSTPGPPPRQNCARPADYWMSHPQKWQYEALVVGGKNYTEQDAMQYFQIGKQQPFDFIYSQIFATANNILSGSDVEAIASTLKQLDQWLISHPEGSTVTTNEFQVGVQMARQLEQYNEGRIGPGLCSDITSVATVEVVSILYTTTPTQGLVTSTPAMIITSTPTLPNRPLPTYTPTPTLRPVRKSGGGGPTSTQPSTSAPPTATKAPPPTNTKAPTKLPTPTSPPLATPVPTKPPNPTQGGGPPTPTTAP
jgi:hypothetical protein